MRGPRRPRCLCVPTRNPAREHERGRPPSRAAGLDSLPGLIGQWAAELGFSRAGIAAIDLSEDETRLVNWLAAGRHGEMGYMARHGRKRSRPADLVAGHASRHLRSHGLLARGRGPDRPPRRSRIRGRGTSRATRSGGTTTASCGGGCSGSPTASASMRGPSATGHSSTSAPVLERALARDAGLGWIGKHTNLIDPRAGSWFFLGELYTDLPLPPATLPPTTAAAAGRASTPARPARSWLPTSSMRAGASPT